MTISVLIVSYNTEELLRDCLNSLHRLTDAADLEIVVVDNGSTDGSCSMVESMFTNVRLIRNSRNAGFGAANNIAYAHCHGAYILLLNSDTIMSSGTISKMTAFMEGCEDAAMVGPSLVTGQGIRQPSGQAYPTLLTEALQLFQVAQWLSNRAFRTFLARYCYLLFPRSLRELLVNYDMPASARSVDWITGACMLVRREVIEQNGLFDERFFLDYEDVDLCKRYGEAGWNVYQLETVPVLHLVGASKRNNYGVSFLEKFRSMLLYFAKHHPDQMRALNTFVVIHAWLALAGTMIPIGHYRDRRRAYRRLLTLCSARRESESKVDVH